MPITTPISFRTSWTGRSTSPRGQGEAPFTGPSGRRIITHAKARTRTESQNVRSTHQSIHWRYFAHVDHGVGDDIAEKDE